MIYGHWYFNYRMTEKEELGGSLVPVKKIKICLVSLGSEKTKIAYLKVGPKMTEIVASIPVCDKLKQIVPGMSFSFCFMNAWVVSQSVGMVFGSSFIVMTNPYFIAFCCRNSPLCQKNLEVLHHLLVIVWPFHLLMRHSKNNILLAKNEVKL